ncbi:MAG: DUF1971 domain-containing protein [Pseudomonadota bacterium]
MTDALTIVGVARLPEGATKYAASPMFDETTAPQALQSEHQTKDGTWALLVVHAGAIDYVVPSRESIEPVKAGEAMVIEPQLVHHIRLTGPVTFVVEFYR